MKCCLSHRVYTNYLAEVDEIKFDWSELSKLDGFIDVYKDKDYIIKCGPRD